MADTVTVDTKPWYESKINWTQILGVGASLLTIFGYTVPPDMIVQVVTAITALQGLLTFVFKTWFTTTVTPASVGK